MGFLPGDVFDGVGPLGSRQLRYGLTVLVEEHIAEIDGGLIGIITTDTLVTQCTPGGTELDEAEYILVDFLHETLLRADPGPRARRVGYLAVIFMVAG